MMDTINQRIAACISETGLTKTAFAKQINLSQPHVSKIALGESSPSDRTISDICREFNVDEIWLRTGKGEMFRARSRSEEIAAFMGDTLRGENDFRQRFIAVLAQLNTQQWGVLEEVAHKLVEEMQKEKTGS